MSEPRTEPLIKPPHPERYDRPLEVSASLARCALSCLALATAGGLVWSCLSTVPLKVAAQGMLISRLGIIQVNAMASGRITDIRVQPGDPVTYGTIVAQIDQIDTADDLKSKKLQRDGYQDEREHLEAFQARVMHARDALARDRRVGLNTRTEDLRHRIESLTLAERNTRSLVDKGYELRTKLIEAADARARAEDELAQVRGSLIQLDGEETTYHTEAARELLAIDLKIAGVKREIEVLTDRLSRTTVMAAPGDGRVVELTASVNDLVGAGRPVMRMLPSGGPETLQGVFYVPAEAGKRVRAGMAVQVVPANARLQRDGYIRARVVAVSELPATREGMQRLLKNETLVQQLTAKGPPYEVTVALERDPASATGFAWSTGHGTAPQPSSGTTAEAKLVVERVPVIALLGPTAETALSWLSEIFS